MKERKSLTSTDIHATYRVERYNALPIDAPSVTAEPLSTTTTTAAANLPPRSPALSTANASIPQQQATATASRASEPQPGSSPSILPSIPASLSQSQVLTASPVTLTSPSGLGTPGAAVCAASGSGEGRDLHLSGHEPRYYPGMVSRSQRRDSMRRESGHESDPR